MSFFSKLFKGIKKVFKKVVKIIKKILPIVVIAAAVYFTAGAAIATFAPSGAAAVSAWPGFGAGGVFSSFAEAVGVPAFQAAATTGTAVGGAAGSAAGAFGADATLGLGSQVAPGITTAQALGGTTGSVGTGASLLNSGAVGTGGAAGGATAASGGLWGTAKAIGSGVLNAAQKVMGAGNGLVGASLLGGFSNATAAQAQRDAAMEQYKWHGASPYGVSLGSPDYNPTFSQPNVGTGSSTLAPATPPTPTLAAPSAPAQPLLPGTQYATYQPTTYAQPMVPQQNATVPMTMDQILANQGLLPWQTSQ